MASSRSVQSVRPRGSRFDLDRLRAIPIASVATDLGFSLTPSGTGRCRLPGHDDQNPSFSVRTLINRFTCYACGGKGDVIALVMAMEGLDFVDACFWLEDQYLGGAPRAVAGRASPTKMRRTTAPLPGPAVETYTNFAPDSDVFEWLLRSSVLRADGEAYLRSRGFAEATIRHFRIGQIEDRGQIMREAAARFGIERLRRCGLTRTGNFGEQFTFPTGYLLFPFIVGGEVAYIQARRPDQDPRWRWLCLNMLLPPVYNQGVLSGNASTISICEGVTDAISAHELGIAAIGLVGANARPDSNTVDRLCGRNVAVFGDADGPGARFSRNLVKLLSAKGITAIPKRLPLGAKDLNDHLRQSRALAT